jgi:hypothetical protein
VNHFAGLLIFSLCVTVAFSLLNRNSARERLLYFLTLFGYMAVGSFIAAWVMYLVP